MAQPFNRAVMTNDGARLLTRAQAGEISIQFTRMAIGNGLYEKEEKELASVQKKTALKSMKNSYGLSDIEIHSDHSVKVTALITNQDPITGQALIEEGFFINEIGLYAKPAGANDKEEILYSIAVTEGENGDFMPPYNGYNPAQIIQDYYATVSNSSEVNILMSNQTVALAEDMQELRRQIVDMNVFAEAIYQQATGYTDLKIAELINGAPETLDTLGEIANAMQQNGDVVQALDDAIGSRASEAEFDSYKKATEKLLGNTDISGIGGGTLTGAVSALNMGIGITMTQAEYDALSDDEKMNGRWYGIIG